MIRITSLCLHNEDLVCTALSAGIKSVHEVLVPRYCSANLRVDIPDTIKAQGYSEVLEEFGRIGMEMIPYKTYTCRTE